MRSLRLLLEAYDLSQKGERPVSSTGSLPIRKRQ